jgi:hypothetical protein
MCDASNTAGLMPLTTTRITSAVAGNPPAVGEHVEIGRHSGAVCARYRITAVRALGGGMYETDLRKVFSVSVPIAGSPGWFRSEYIDA